MDRSEVLRSSLERFKASATAKGVEIAIVEDPAAAGGTAAADGASFVADRGAVERIMANLISNALAAAPAPGGHLWLRAEAGPAETVVLSVTDDGPGFPPGAAARAFERFYRADPSRSGPGSGLGLAIVREFAAAHGGTAHAENVAPRGARVSVVLPRVPKPATPADSR
jgi:signal transduction histidine kinase